MIVIAAASTLSGSLVTIFLFFVMIPVGLLIRMQVEPLALSGARRAAAAARFGVEIHSRLAESPVRELGGEWRVVMAMSRVTVTQFLGGMPPGEVRCELGHLGLGGRGGDAPPDVLDGPAGSVPRAAVRHVALEVALWEGGRDDPTVAEVAPESGLDASTTRAALAILAQRTGYPLG